VLWQIQAAEIVDIDNIRTWRHSQEHEAAEQIAGLITRGKKTIWVIDSAGVLKKFSDIGKAIAEEVSGMFDEASAYAGEAQEWEEEGELSDLSQKWRTKRPRVMPITSPRSGKPGYKITW